MIEQGQELNRVAGYFKVLADHSRVQILTVLLHGESCVSDLAADLGMTQSAVSHHLRILKSEHLVKARKDGKQVIYFILDSQVQDLLRAGQEHIRRYSGSGGYRNE